MKKITLILLSLFACLQMNGQTCNQTFTASGQDNTPTVLTINAADVTCYGANPVTSLRLTNAAGSLISGFCAADGSSWFSFDLSIDGGPAITGCAAAFNNLDITGFTTLTITSSDDDVWSDTVTIAIDVEATFVPSTPPSCVTLSSPANGALNVSSTLVSWPAAAGGASGYRLSVGSSSGATDVLNNFDVGNVLSYSLTGLVGGSTYYVTVYPYNVNGAATGCVESNFTTCDIFTVPFLETFDSTSSSESCWSILNVNGDGDTWNTSYTNTPITGDQSANIYTDFNGGLNDDWLISPRITLTGNQRLVFKYKVQSEFEPNDFRVMLSTTGNAPANFTTELASLASYSNTTPATMALDLTGVSGDVYFAWHVPSGGLDGWRIYIDDVVVEDTPAVAPSCVAITSPANNAVNVMNSNVAWASDLDATGYRISVGTTSGATDVLNNFDVGNVLSYSFPTDAGTTYFVTVFPYNAFGQATGCTEINFTTCDALTVPHLEQFDTFLPSCWQEADGGDLTAGPATFGASSWAADGFGNAGGTGAVKINIDFTGDNDWIISPVVNIPATGYELKFDAAVTQWNGTGAPTTPWEADD
ncbi:MAG: choice-of-anchor J domain-containing protein, partial [Bacteroidia bacterium]